MRNIAFFNTNKFWGGGEKFNLDHALAIKELGYNVLIICSENSVLSERCDALEISYETISKVGNLSFLNPFIIRRLNQILKTAQIDTLLFSNSIDLKIGFFASFFHVIERKVYRRGLAVPVKNGILNRLIFNRYLSHVFANSEETRNTILQNLTTRFKKEDIGVIYNGISVDEYISKIHKAERLSFIEDQKKGVVIGNAGRLTKQKGQDQLIILAKNLKDKGVNFSLFIAGKGEEEDALHALIDKYDLRDEVFLLGFVENIPAFMKSLDVFILSSHWEGFGYVLAEAMLAELPTLAFDISSNAELIKNKVSGYLVPCDNHDEMTLKTKALVDNSELRAEMGANGRKLATEQFEIKLKAQEIIAFIKGNT
jgi:glycosyltransferase involved in cell wall biosynthesis